MNIISPTPHRFVLENKHLDLQFVNYILPLLSKIHKKERPQGAPNISLNLQLCYSQCQQNSPEPIGLPGGGDGISGSALTAWTGRALKRRIVFAKF